MGAFVFSAAARTTAGVVTVEVAGELDASTAPLLEAEFAEVLRRDPEALVADLADVTFCGSAGLSALLTLKFHCVTRDVRLQLVPSRVVRRAIELTGLDEVLGSPLP
ncbi:STAS domain-containing protein [Amycolatopsis sp. NPDC004368]